MSWTNSHTSLNNYNKEYPEMMSDGRILSNWKFNTDINNEIIERENIQSNHDYRTYLTNNAEEIIKMNKLSACNQAQACRKNVKSDVNIDNKYIFKSVTDNNVPYGYETSDLKSVYLSRQELQARLSAPIVNKKDLIKFEKY